MSAALETSTTGSPASGQGAEAARRATTGSAADGGQATEAASRVTTGLASRRLARMAPGAPGAAHDHANRDRPAVGVLDRIDFPNVETADRWLATRDLATLPVARIWRTFTGPESVALFVLWEVPTVRAFYALRADPKSRDFWPEAGARTREVLEPLWPAI